jgi:queuine tRNA-ribosyltransferase
MSGMSSSFGVRATDGDARSGVLRTPHGDLPTPAFLPVATLGAVKALDPRDLASIKANIVLANAYHLYLRPGIDVVERLGGLHGFMGWKGPILTDSGGFQSFSLKHLREITEDAIVFRSHIDGSMHSFTPEASVRYQEALGADIIMPLDVCVASDAGRVATEEALERTSRWVVRCREAHTRDDQMLFGIVQGGLFPDLRERSADFMTSVGFPGYAIGGLSVGESKEQMYQIASDTAKMLPAESPRYLMGVGSPEDLVQCVAGGVDMFDCVLPTRIARNGALFVRKGRVNIDKAPFKNQEGPIEEGCDCYTCRTFSAAYVHHLFRSKELLAYRLATVHNLRFLLRLMEEMRAAIEQGRFGEYRDEFIAGFAPTDEQTRRLQKSKWEAAQRRRGQQPKKGSRRT